MPMLHLLTLFDPLLRLSLSLRLTSKFLSFIVTLLIIFFTLPFSLSHEKTLRCPQNGRVKNPSRYFPIAQAQLQSKLAAAQAYAETKHPISFVIGSLLTAASTYANNLRTSFSSGSAKPLIKRNEPSTARANGLLGIVIPLINPHPAPKPSVLRLTGTITQLYYSDTYREAPRLWSPTIVLCVLRSLST